MQAGRQRTGRLEAASDSSQVDVQVVAGRLPLRQLVGLLGAGLHNFWVPTCGRVFTLGDSRRRREHCTGLWGVHNSEAVEALVAGDSQG